MSTCIAKISYKHVTLDYNLGNYCWNTFEPLVKMNPLSPLFNVARSHFIITRAGSPNIDWWGWGRDMS